MVEQAVGQDGHVQEVKHQSALFYADYSMVASSDPRWLQGGFSTLVGLFAQLVLKTHIGKSFGMVCRTC